MSDGREFVRLQPVEAAAAQQYGALLIDIRPAAQRRFTGEVPGALIGPAWAAMSLPICVGLTPHGHYVEDLDAVNLPCGASA
jgi:hypothetical protein